MLPEIDAVLFDLDGTLVDSAPDLGAAADQMRTDRGLASLSIADYRPMAGAGARGMLQVAFGLSPDAPEFDDLKAEFLNNYERRLTQHTFIFDGITAVIEQILRDGRKWGVVTNKAERFTVPLTRSMPLFSSALTIVCGDTTPHAKPHPAPLFEAARQLGLSPERCIYVGDDQRDIVAGRAAGMLTVAAAYGYLGAPNELKHWEADYVIAHPEQLLTLLKMP